MNIKRTIALVSLILSAWTRAETQVPPFPAPGQTVPALQDIVATEAFEARINEYVALHRLLEGPLPPLRATRNITQVQASMRELALRIQLVRANARQGDLISPDVGRMFRRRIAACLPPEQWAAILAENAEAEQDVRIGQPPALHVNVEWPEQVPIGFVPPQMLATLPLLPPELQYRIIGNTLVLWDHHANLIIDFLPGAFSITS
jgi:hypothetical protein